MQIKSFLSCEGYPQAFPSRFHRSQVSKAKPTGVVVDQRPSISPLQWWRGIQSTTILVPTMPFVGNQSIDRIWWELALFLLCVFKEEAFLHLQSQERIGIWFLFGRHLRFLEFSNEEFSAPDFIDPWAAGPSLQCLRRSLPWCFTWHFNLGFTPYIFQVHDVKKEDFDKQNFHTRVSIHVFVRVGLPSPKKTSFHNIDPRQRSHYRQLINI